MQAKKFLTLLAIGAFLVGCGGSSEEDNIHPEYYEPRDLPPGDELPELANPFEAIPEYSFDDFQLDSDVLYWEIRVGSQDPQAGGTTEAAWRYDADRYQALTQEQRAQLDATESTGRLQDWCQTEYCVNYGAAITEEGVEVLHDEPDLLAFFGQIDSEAKLSLWLWANQYNGMSFEAEDAGYSVVALRSDPMCVEDVYYRLFVDTNGVITEVEELLRRDPALCP